jgi:hypothetical protein
MFWGPDSIADAITAWVVVLPEEIAAQIVGSSAETEPETQSDVYEDTTTASNESAGEEESEGESGEGIDQESRTFTNFGNLPTEIQLMVWKYAVPNPRRIPEAILAFVNFDLENPRAILPPRRDFINMYNRNLIPPEVHEPSTEWDVNARTEVIYLLHTCRNSRAAAGHIFCLDMDSTEDDWNTDLWDPATDTIYLPCFLFSWPNFRFIRWLSTRRERPSQALKSVRHVALYLDNELMNAMRRIPALHADPTQSWDDWGVYWLDNLPSLQTLNLCVDPMGFTKRTEGSLVPYESQDVPIEGIEDYPRPTEIEEEVTEFFESLLGEGIEAPLVEVSVLCWRKPQTSKSRKIRGRV